MTTMRMTQQPRCFLFAVCLALPNWFISSGAIASEANASEAQTGEALEIALVENAIDISVDPQKQTQDDLPNIEQALRSLNVELQILEEDLLYPASSRVSVYLAMDIGELFSLQSVKLKLNGKDVTHHLYTERQLNALYRGGVQQLYMGNAKQGMNKLVAVFLGVGPHDREYKRAVEIEFEQSFEPVYVELGINDSMGKQQPVFTAKAH